jgi:non-canonical purine NTP pyrophosphatase (RdgB/HAM1 family)
MTVKHRILIGTSNPKKLREMQALLGDEGGLNCEILNLDDVAPDLESPEETGKTFIENAELKALYFANHTGLVCIADDSGLEVDALDGAPGIYSARFAEGESGDAANNAKLIRELQGVSEAERGAGYRCAIAVAAPGKVLERFEETCRGRIVDEARGEGGFGYDPHFFVPELNRTFAEVSAEQKAEISHRGQALRRLRADLPAILSILDNSQNL